MFLGVFGNLELGGESSHLFLLGVWWGADIFVFKGVLWRGLCWPMWVEGFSLPVNWGSFLLGRFVTDHGFWVSLG